MPEKGETGPPGAGNRPSAKNNHRNFSALCLQRYKKVENPPLPPCPGLPFYPPARTHTHTDTRTHVRAPRLGTGCKGRVQPRGGVSGRPSPERAPAMPLAAGRRGEHSGREPEGSRRRVVGSLAPQPGGQGKAGLVFGASEHHQFWPPPLGTPNLSWQCPARRRALPLLFLLWTASAPQEWPSFLIILLGGKKHSVKPQPLPRAPAALPTASRLCQMGTETCSWVRAGSTESKSLRSGTRKRGMEQEWVAAVPAGHRSGCFCFCTVTSQSSWHLSGPGDICHPPWGLT